MHCDRGTVSFEGAKPTKGRGAFMEVPYFLSKHDPAPLRPPATLFKKLEESVIEKEYARLEA